MATLYTERWAKVKHRTLTALAIDDAIVFVVLTKVWLGLTGVVSIYLMVRALSAEEQGFYYTFTSVLAVQIVFELGLAFVLAQFSAHEMVELRESGRGRVSGSEEAKRRLYSLFWLAARWYGAIVVLAASSTVIVGRWFFTGASRTGIQWQAPWFSICVLASVSLLLSPFLAIYEGQGHVRRIAKARFIASIGSSLSLWVGFAAGFRLWAAVLPQLVSAAGLTAWYVLVNADFLAEAQRYRRSAGVSWRREIWPLQWRIALSWLSGFLIFYLFNPILFKFQGPAAAGRVGLTLAITGIISQSAFSWMQTKAPTFARLVAEKRFHEMDALFRHTLRASLALLVAAYLCLIAAYGMALSLRASFVGRIVSIEVLAMIAGASILNHVVWSVATYLRSFKREPFLMLSVVSASSIAIGIVAAARYSTIPAVFLVNLLATFLITFCGALWVFRTRRQEYQNAALGTPEMQSLVV
jgi:O-antigen/teichoic acid export membrane protein